MDTYAQAQDRIARSATEESNDCAEIVNAKNYFLLPDILFGETLAFMFDACVWMARIGQDVFDVVIDDNPPLRRQW